MAVSDKSIDPRILSSAKAEFLAHGFEATMLSNICKQAGVTTGALYKRYSGKEELFAAVVSDTVDELNAYAQSRTLVSPESLSDEELLALWDMDDDSKSMLKWFEFLDKRRDGFLLLINCSAGTRYEKFQHDWVENMSRLSYSFYHEMVIRGLAKEDISMQEMHILLTAFWATVYEPFIHGYDISQIKEHCNIVCRLFNWAEVFHFKKV